jgi:uncharacterized protein (DUF983 family)
MHVTRRQILARGLTHRCPNCGERTLFGPLRWWLRAAKECRVCGLVFERGEGFFLGAVVINYAVTGLLLVPVLVLVATGSLEVGAAVALLAAWAVLFPVLFFRTAKSLWLMAYYLFVPADLPANGGDRAGR